MKMCPLTKNTCIEDKCAWWVGMCAVAAMAIPLEEIGVEEEGEPPIQ